MAKSSIGCPGSADFCAFKKSSNPTKDPSLMVSRFVFSFAMNASPAPLGRELDSLLCNGTGHGIGVIPLFKLRPILLCLRGVLGLDVLSRCSGKPAALLKSRYFLFRSRRRIFAFWASFSCPAASYAVFRRFCLRISLSIFR